jgi:hypothetical protein
VFFVRETTSELETCNLADPVICRCRKHQQCFDGPFTKMHCCCQSDIGFILGKTIHFGILEFIVNRFSNLSLSTEGNDSSNVFVGMVDNGSLFVHKVPEESSDDGNTASSRGGALASPFLKDATR